MQIISPLVTQFLHLRLHTKLCISTSRCPVEKFHMARELTILLTTTKKVKVFAPTITISTSLGMINSYKGKLAEELHLAEKHHFTKKRKKTHSR